MLFTVKSDEYTPAGMVVLKLKRFARSRIYRWKLSGNDIAVDNFCRKTYKISLKEMCWYIIKKIKVLQSGVDNTYSIILPDQKLDKVAHIIMYGNGEFLGSKILQEALKF